MEAIVKTLNQIVEKNLQSSHNEENTYIKDDLKHCKICDAPLETYFTNPITKEDKKVSCICKCDVERLKKEEEESEKFKRKIEIEKLRINSLLGERYKNVSFENTETNVNKTFDIAFNRCRKYCDISSEVLSKGYGIYIWGDKGTGKTRLTACMANNLIQKNHSVLFTNFFEISNSIRNTYTNHNDTEMNLIERITNVDFLFLDDLGTEKVTNNGQDNWLQSKVFEILNKRYNNKKPTIFTSNYSLRDLFHDRGMLDKTVDRIIEMSTVILKVEGKSYRQSARSNDIPF